MTYISIQQILDDLLSDGMMKELSLERAINYAVEFIKIVGMPNVFEEKVVPLHIVNYRAELPGDFYEPIQVRIKDGPALVSSTDSFGGNSDNTYKIQGTCIFINKEDEFLELAYRAIKQDADGLPMIVDNGTFAKALELYIQKRWFTSLFNSGRLPSAVLQNVKQEYAWVVGQAQNDLVRPTMDQMQSLTNMLTSFLPNTNAHLKGFKNGIQNPENFDEQKAIMDSIKANNVFLKVK